MYDDIWCTGQNLLCDLIVIQEVAGQAMYMMVLCKIWYKMTAYETCCARDEYTAHVSLTGGHGFFFGRDLFAALFDGL